MAKIIGTSKANTLKGKWTTDNIYGNGGDDDIKGGSGSDWLQGGTGNDELTGGAGHDTFVFSSGRDEFDDFSTRDDEIVIDTKLGIKSFADLMKTAKVVDGGEDVRFDFGNGHTLTLEDTKLSSLNASHFSFQPVNTAGPKDPLFGNDTLTGNSKANKISGGAGDDTIKGLDGNDRLNGDSGNDELEGGSGNDRLDGGSGVNELEGGVGRDTFVFKTGRTEIEDFKVGFDKIEIAKSLGVSSFDGLTEIARTVDRGGDLVFDFGKIELRLDDTKLSELSASDFLFI